VVKERVACIRVCLVGDGCDMMHLFISIIIIRKKGLNKQVEKARSLIASKQFPREKGPKQEQNLALQLTIRVE